jgi:hypothetical protein
MGLWTGFLLAGGKFINDALRLTIFSTIPAMAADAVLCGAVTMLLATQPNSISSRMVNEQGRSEGGFQGAVPGGPYRG